MTSRVRFAFLAFLALAPAGAGAATRTIANGGGNWNALGTWVEGAVPTAADDVVATATSGNLTINVAAACRSFNLTNYTKIVTHAAAVTLSIGDATAGAGSKALVFPAAGWTYTLGNGTTSAISFITTSATAQDVDFAGKTPGNVTFNGAGAKWNVIGSMGGSSNTITLTNGTINVNHATAFGGGTVTIAGAVVLDNTSAGAITLTSNNVQNWNSNFTFTGTKDLNLGTGAVAMNATRTLTVNGGNLTAGGIISGVGFGITKAGAGTLIVSGNNAFTGAVTLSAGTLRATTSANALGTGAATLALNGGTLQLADNTGLNFARNTTVGGATTITSDRTTSGAGVTNTLGTLSIGNFQLNITSGTNVATGPAGITFGATTLSAATPKFDVISGMLLTLGAITGNFAMTKQNSGELELTAASLRSAGVTTLTAGTLTLDSASALGTTATTLALNGGTLDLAINSTVNAYPTTVGGAATIASDRATSGAGVTHTLGTLSIGNFQLSITSGAAVTSGTPGVTFGATTLSASTPKFDVVDTAVLTLGAIGGNFNMTKQNLGQLTAGGASARAGGVTTLTDGTLKVSAAAGLGTAASTLVLNGGTLDLAVNTTVNAHPTTIGGDVTIMSDRATAGAGVTHTLGTLSIGSFTLNAVVGSGATSGSSGITFGATTVTGNPTFDVLSSVSPAVPLTVTLAAVGDGAAARTITKANTGILTFSAAATSLVNGTSLNITGGSVNSNNATALGALAAVDVISGSTFTAGATQTIGALTNGGITAVGVNTLTVGGTNNLTSDYPGTFTGSGGVTKAGTGTLTLSGNSSFTGLMRLNAGTLRATTSVNALGTGAATLSLFGGTLELADDTGLNFARNTTVSAAATITSDRTTSGAGVTNTLGTLSIGNFQLNITSGTNVATGPAGITFGATTLSASTPKLDVINGTLLTLGAISGNFNMTKQNSGDLELTAASLRSAGITTLTAGTLTLDSASALGTTATTLALNGGTLDLAINSTVNAYPTTVGGAATIASDRATSGAGVAHTLGTLSIGNFQLNITSGAAVVSGAPGITFGATTLTASTPVFDVIDTAVLTLGAIGGNFNLTKQNLGQLTAGGASTRAGGVTTLTDGTLKVSAAAGLGTAASTLVLNGGTLDLAVNTTVNAHPTTIGGDVTIMSDRATAGAGVTHTLGTLSIGSFTLNAVVGSGATSGSSGITFGATTLTGNPTFDVLSSVSPAVPLTLTLAAVGDGAVARTITKANTGILTFSAAATSLVNGTTLNITGGTVNSNNATAVGALAAVDVVAGSTFTAGATQTLGTISNGGNVGFGAFTLTIGGTNNLSSTFSGILSGSGSLTKAGTGTLTVSGTATVGGNLAVNAGTLAGTGNVTVNGNVTGSGSAGTINLTGGTFEQRVAAAQTFGTNVAGANNWTFNNLSFTNSSVVNRIVTVNPTGTGQIIVNGALTVGNAGDSNTTTLDDNANDRTIDINGDMVITSKGVYSASSSVILTVGGDWTNSGTYTNNSSTVTFDGGAVTHQLAGTSSFYVLRSVVVGATLRFASGTTTTVTNAIVLQDATLASSAPGVQWNINFSGTSQTLTNLAVQDSDASGGVELIVTGGTDNGNNLNWDFDVPGAITTMVLTSTTGATLRVTWTSVGDDNLSGTITGGAVTIQYTTDTVFSSWSPTAGQPAYVFRVTIPQNSVAPGTASTAFIPGLTGGATYFVRMWTNDSSSRFSAISNAGNTPIAIPNINLLLSQTTIGFGSLSAGSTTVITSSITITNTGNTNQSYRISITNPANWTATSGAPGTDQFRLTAVIRSTLPSSSDFNTANDVVTTSPNNSSDTALAVDSDAQSQKGVNVLPGQTRGLWFRVEMPSMSSTTNAQTVNLSALAL